MTGRRDVQRKRRNAKRARDYAAFRRVILRYGRTVEGGFNGLSPVTLGGRRPVPILIPVPETTGTIGGRARTNRLLTEPIFGCLDTPHTLWDVSFGRWSE